MGQGEIAHFMHGYNTFIGSCTLSLHNKIPSFSEPGKKKTYENIVPFLCSLSLFASYLIL